MIRLLGASVSLLLMLALPVHAQTWPNEPPGSTTLNDMSFSCVVCNGWVDYSGSTTITADPSAPISPASVLRQTFPAGLVGGNGGGGANAYNFPGLTNDVFFGYWFKVDSNYVNHPVGTKLSWIHTDTSLLNEFILRFDGPDPYVITAHYQNTYADNSHLGGPSPAGTIIFYPNGGSFTRNQWVRVEQYFKPASCLTCRDGIWRVWINGTKTHDLSTLNTRATTKPGGVSFITVWGGVGSIMPSNSYLYYDHAHVSIPNCGGGCPSGGGGGTAPPPPPPLAPNKPTNLRVQ